MKLLIFNHKRCAKCIKLFCESVLVNATMNANIVVSVFSVTRAQATNQ